MERAHEKLTRLLVHQAEHSIAQLSLLVEHLENALHGFAQVERATQHLAHTIERRQLNLQKALAVH